MKICISLKTYLFIHIYISDEIELGNYEDLEKCTSIATVTSVLKAFIRQMPEPLLTRDCQQLIEQAQIDFLGNSNEGLMVAQLKGIFMTMDSLTYSVLKYILLHLKDISEAKGEKLIVVQNQNIYLISQR